MRWRPLTGNDFLRRAAALGRREPERLYLVGGRRHLLHVALNHVLGFVTGAWNGKTEFRLWDERVGRRLIGSLGSVLSF